MAPAAHTVGTPLKYSGLGQSEMFNPRTRSPAGNVRKGTAEHLHRRTALFHPKPRADWYDGRCVEHAG
jgi:hypothetical protein